MVVVETPFDKANTSLAELKRRAKEFYNAELRGKSVVNKDKGITVVFSSSGRDHVLYARQVGFEKLVAVFHLPEMVREATFTNFKVPTKGDSEQILGFANFRVAVVINGKPHHFRLAVRISKNGKFFYDHAVWVKSKG